MAAIVGQCCSRLLQVVLQFMYSNDHHLANPLVEGTKLGTLYIPIVNATLPLSHVADWVEKLGIEKPRKLVWIYISFANLLFVSIINA